MSTAKPVLEGAAQAFAAKSNPPFLHDLGPVEGRRAVDGVQEGDVPVPDAGVEDLVVPGGPSGQVPIRVFRPARSVVAAAMWPPTGSQATAARAGLHA